jgi:hypothetical protein
MSIDREALERLALEICSPDLYYDLADNIDDLDNSELNRLIDADGDFEQELAIYNLDIKDFE